jgi:hypothetical protein
LYGWKAYVMRIIGQYCEAPPVPWIFASWLLCAGYYLRSDCLLHLVGNGLSSTTGFVQHTACILEFSNQLSVCAMGDGSSSGMICVEVLCYSSIWPALASTQQYQLNAFVFRQRHLESVKQITILSMFPDFMAAL